MVTKITWQKAGRVTGAGPPSMFRSGWLTVAAEDVAVWEKFSDAYLLCLFRCRPTPTAPRSFTSAHSTRPATPCLAVSAESNAARFSRPLTRLTDCTSASDGVVDGAARRPCSRRRNRRFSPLSPATAGDHGRSIPAGLTASTTKLSSGLSPQRHRNHAATVRYR